MPDPILYGKGSCCRIYIDTQDIFRLQRFPRQFGEQERILLTVQKYFAKIRIGKIFVKNRNKSQLRKFALGDPTAAWRGLAR